ncbi:thiol-disulfide isomerase/thioredoxin [Arenibacter sp. ARW7G5Y1]|nr:thiol-disulfide isomerase/thioredoxin [Arenibacter sp. ARW7G5Y1]
MRTITIIFTILIFGFISCSIEKKKEITINGQIVGHGNPDKIEFTIPIDGKWFYGDKKSITTDSTGKFQIKIDTDNPSFTTIYVPGKSGGILLTEPGQTYNVNIELDKERKSFYIDSPNSNGQRFYNTLPAPEFHMMGLSEFYNDSIPEEISSKINSLRESEISKFHELLKKKEISKDFHQLAVLDREVYYSALEAGAASILLQKYLNEKESLVIDSLKKFWNTKLKVSNIIGNDSDRSPWFYTLASNFIRYAQLSSEEFDPEILKKKYETGDIYQYNIDEAKKYLAGEELEYYLASYIYYESWQTKDNSKKIIGAYENFRKEHPQSPYNEYLEASIKPIVTFHKNLKNAKANEKIEFVENYEEIDTFKDLISKLNGKKVFVDIWGTWCAPCKKEFEHKKSLEQLLNSKEIASLYICEGKNSKEKVWHEMIKSYDLEGYHLLTNEKLLTDIINEFGNNGRFAYPRYLLVDENGKVVNGEASYPSQIIQLEKEINENYVW